MYTVTLHSNCTQEQKQEQTQTQTQELEQDSQEQEQAQEQGSCQELGSQELGALSHAYYCQVWPPHLNLSGLLGFRLPSPLLPRQLLQPLSWRQTGPPPPPLGRWWKSPGVGRIRAFVRFQRIGTFLLIFG